MRKYPAKDKDIRIIFKKSTNTIYTQSRTCSGVSQFYTRSAILQIKKNLSEVKDQYIINNKIKRDLSVETDICVLRRYYKSKRSKMSSQGSAKSKYSTVIDKELNEIDEYNKTDSSACGDSKRSFANSPVKVDLATAMIENLKILLNNWINKHLIDRNDDKEEVNTVLNCMLQDINSIGHSNSRSTYILNREQGPCQVKNKKLETTSVMCKYCKRKSKPILIGSKTIIHKGFSSYSVPLSIKKIKLISTLSIPRYVHKMKKINSLHIRKVGAKKITVTIAKSSHFLESSLDTLSTPTRSLTKRCATYNLRNRQAPKPMYNKPAINNVYPKQVALEHNLEGMPSMFQSIYADGGVNVTSNGNTIFKVPDEKIKTMPDININKPHKIHVRNSKCVIYKSDTRQTSKSIQNKDTNDIFFNKVDNTDALKNNHLINKRNNNSICTKVNKVGYRFHKFTRRPTIGVQNKKTSSQSKSCKQREEKYLLKNFQNVLKYFSTYGGNKNINFDISINFLPTKGIDKCTTVTSEILSNNVTCRPTLTNLEKRRNIKTEDIQENYGNPKVPEIMNVSSVNNVQRVECKTSDDLFDIIIENKKSSNSDALILAKEIKELKSVIKDLSITAKSFTAEDISNNRTVIDNSSKAVQLSSNFQKLVECGIKLSNEPKKDDKIMKESDSYNIIDSESILKVTDMTIIHEINNNKKKEKGLTCSLPKSRSLFEMINDKERARTYYCGRCTPKSNFGYDCKPISYSNCGRSRSKCSDVQHKYDEESSSENSSCYPIRKPSINSECKIISEIDFHEKNSNGNPYCIHKGIGFGEGFLYCLLLWIPVIILFCLFYSYVLHDKINSAPISNRLRNSAHFTNKENNSVDITLSDLGF